MDLFEKAERYLATSVWKPNFIFTKAKGSQIWLNDQPYLDFATGPGVANIGHNHPEVKEAVKKVYDNDEAGYGGNILMNKYQIELAEKLCELTPGKFPKRVFFSNSGGEAVDAAIYACLKKRPERRGMLSLIGDFHGRLFSRTATTSRQLHIEGLPWGAVRPFFLIFPAENPETSLKTKFMDMISTPQNYLDYVENTVGPFIKEINFALFELVQGEGGINIAKKEMIQALFQYLRENKVWIIVDEVQSGLGRTGKMWASDIYEVEPDIMTIAKALSGGGAVPIGATVMREELSYAKTSEHCNTYGGNPPACAVGLKVLDIIEREKLADQSKSKGQTLRDVLQILLNCGPFIVDVSGCGLMNRATFRDSYTRDQVITEAMTRGLFLMGAGERSVRLMPPLTISQEEMEQAIKILIDSIQAAH